MCDCCSLECSEPGCQRKVPVHIADFCTPRDTIEVRCSKHPPGIPDGWVRFCAIRDLSDRYLSPFYMRLLVREPIVVNRFARRRITKWPGYAREIEPFACYWVGGRGGICPNAADFKQEYLTVTEMLKGN